LHRTNGTHADRPDLGIGFAKKEAVMRRVSSLAVSLIAAVLALGVVPVGASAQTESPPPSDQGFVGAWHLATETPFGASQSLFTIMADGTVVFSDRPVFPGNEGFPNTFFSAGHGAWEQTGPTTAAATWLFFMTDGEGNFLGVITDSAEMTLGADGTSWSGPFSSSTSDPVGNVLFVGGGTAQATRITVQPLATPAASPAPSAAA
jgi:hypothetical protein